MARVSRARAQRKCLSASAETRARPSVSLAAKLATLPLVSEHPRDGAGGGGEPAAEDDVHDLARFVQHRQLDMYEQTMARLAYAYGVDIRRSRWLVHSSLGNTLVRAVDRGWPELSATLMRDELDGADAIPAAILARISRIQSLLRAPRPSLRRLRHGPRGPARRWPAVTPLGATHGDVGWLVVDIDALRQAGPEAGDFMIGAGLGHLQCDHAIFFTAHLLAVQRTPNLSVQLVRRALAPWSRVMAFSADRAGMLATGELEGALAGMLASVLDEDRATEPRPWLPRPPSYEQRKQALEEFARTEVFARMRALRLADPTGATLLGNLRGARPAAQGVGSDTWSLARVDERLTRRLRLL